MLVGSDYCPTLDARSILQSLLQVPPPYLNLLPGTKVLGRVGVLVDVRMVALAAA
jgi:hypothetical protein